MKYSIRWTHYTRVLFTLCEFLVLPTLFVSYRGYVGLRWLVAIWASLPFVSLWLCHLWNRHFEKSAQVEAANVAREIAKYNTLSREEARDVAMSALRDANQFRVVLCRKSVLFDA